MWLPNWLGEQCKIERDYGFRGHPACIVCNAIDSAHFAPARRPTLRALGGPNRSSQAHRRVGGSLRAARCRTRTGWTRRTRRPYITINDGGWDTHTENFRIMQQKLPELDQGLATLLEDLADRGLLETTVVWWCGEFGRTPKIDWQPPWNGGRNHYGKVFSAVVAGRRQKQ